MATRLKDIARDLGLSVVTVSKVLRQHPDISEQTRKRVLKRVAELNYQPNYAARTLITGRTWTVGLVVPDLLHPFFANIAKAISKAIRSQGFSLFISSSNEEPELERKDIQQLLARRVDVIIVASVQSSVESFRQIEEQKIPLLLLDRVFRDFPVNSVAVDDVAVGMLGTSHLIEQGCKRIAHMRGPEISTALGRMEGYKRALAEHQMKVRPEYIVPIGAYGDHRAEVAGYEAAKRLLACDPRPDGLFCFNDIVALGAMRAILEVGLRIPEDIAVVGSGNLSYSDFLRVPLSSVDQGSSKIGAAAAAMALRLAHDRNPSAPRMELVQPHLVVRASSLRRP